VRNQRGRAELAPSRNSQSLVVISRSAPWAWASQAMKKVIRAETPVGQAPTPPPPAHVARNTSRVVTPQISQENTWGRVRPERIETI
jgi:hypothetical protein